MKMKNFILQKESDDEIQQIKVNSKQALFLGSILICIFLSIVFISAEILNDLLYEKRIKQFKKNYELMSDRLKFLKEKLKKIDDKILEIEEKDNALRSYAGMPEIDLDIRKLGTGGNDINSNILADNIAPVTNKELLASYLELYFLPEQEDNKRVIRNGKISKRFILKSKSKFFIYKTHKIRLYIH